MSTDFRPGAYRRDRTGAADRVLEDLRTRIEAVRHYVRHGHELVREHAAGPDASPGSGAASRRSTATR